RRGLHLDFPHSPFSAIYGVPINSPGTLYPTDLPPPYESVVGHTPASQFSHYRLPPASSNRRQNPVCVSETPRLDSALRTSVASSGGTSAISPLPTSPSPSPPSRSRCPSVKNPAGEDPTHKSPEQGTVMEKSRKQQKEGRKVDIQLKPQGLHTHPPSERPHSLADLKMYKDTKILVAKFLEHSSCSLPPDVQQVVNNIRCVIKLDEKHMEEAIFSANVIDQMMSQRTTGSPRKHGQEDLHLQSCGALSSSPSARRPKCLPPTTSASAPLRDAREQGLECKETIL
uniref:Family with sequence similarity 189 member A1 n=1 Tax=Tetraodon nigroviridis TaxID=99883 RepID=H3CVI2_TETNG